jgi:hypothetical protein
VANHIDEPYAAEHAQAMEMLSRMTREERRALLRKAGILDEQDHLTERYMPPEEVLREQRRLEGSGQGLRLHSSAFQQPAAWYVTRGDSLSGEVVSWGETPAEAVDKALVLVGA